ncbi:MAG: hypothetical protein VYA30_11985 [Myxococcota bacterium]|nr:hypothetical protein [Myxococcota bacterium]
MTDGLETAKNGGLLGFLEETADSHRDPAQQSQLDQAKEAFRALEKLIKNVSLYGLEHQSTDRFLQNTYIAFQDAISTTGELEIIVRPYDLTVHDEAVLENPSPERNFIYTLYLDGVRRLCFLPQITADELFRFVQILLTDWDQPGLFEDDMVTLLWSEHFLGLKYSVLDNFAEDIREDDSNTYTVAGVIDRVRAKGRFLAEKPDSLAADGASRRLKRVNLSGMSVTDTDLSEFSEVVFAMDPTEFRRLQRTVHTTAREKLEKFIEILFKVHLIQEVSEEARRGRITELFDRIADLLLENGAIGELERLLRTIRRLNGPENQVIRENVLAIEHIVDHWSAQPFIDRITLGLRQPGFSYRPSVIGICQLLSKRAASHIARVAGRIDDPATRELLWQLVSEKLSGQERSIADLLRDANRQHAHEIFRLLKKAADPDELKYAIEVALGNPDPSVRLEALTNLPTKRVDVYHKPLIRMLTDKAKPIRSRALHLLARCQKQSVHERIVACINQKEFGDFELDEKRRFFAAAALTGGTSEYWLEQFRANALLSTKGQDALRHCAAVAIGIRVYQDGLSSLEKEVKRRLKYPLAAEGAAWAVQHMQCDRDERTRQLYELFYHGQLVTQTGVLNV